MRTDNITFKIIEHGSTDYQNAVTLRQKILREPFGKTFTAEELEQEKGHIQIAGFLNNEIVATALLTKEKDRCKMQRVAVKTEMQDHGIGSKLIEFFEQVALKNGFREIYCHARVTAIPFYLKHNYQLVGHVFQENGTPHQNMLKVIS